MTKKLEKLIAANDALKQEIAERMAAFAETESVARLAEENPNPVMRVTIDGAVLYANDPATELLALWGIEVGDGLPSDWCRAVDEAAEGRKGVDLELELGDRFLALTLQPVVDAEYVNVYGRDITKRKENEEQIVNYDDLTGLPNRALFQDRLRQVLSHARRTGKLAAVHIIDVDHFKDINETMGHDAGDELLRGIGERLEGCVRTSDTVARLGGDEFGVIQVEPADSDGIAVLAQKLLTCLDQPFRIEGRDVHAGASIGITVFPDDAENPEEVLRNADMALYHGKGDERGSYRFYVARMNDEIQRRRAIEDDMRRGLERGDFVLHYQPKLHIALGRVTGMEALVRWNHPEQGFMSPAEFIPVAERSRLIVPLGEWVLREACARNKAWIDAGLGPVKVAVNLSAVQLRDSGLTALIGEILEDTGLDASGLELEITESLAMQNAEATINLFDEISGIGVALSIDDFGTGYSSLSYLRSFPVQRIKIDKAFIDDIGPGGNGGENSGAIARAVTTLGKSFGMEITAEGVETEDQLAFLTALGCDEIQGYYFSRPLPEAELGDFLAGYEAAAGMKPQAAPQGAA